MSDTKQPAIEFRNVYLTFDDRTVLNDINFTLAEGEMIFLTGISGSGKSVLLRLAMGLLKPRLGPNLHQWTRDREARRVGSPRDQRRIDGDSLSGRFAVQRHAGL